jgi:hypothetical protein
MDHTKKVSYVFKSYLSMPLPLSRVTLFILPFNSNYLPQLKDMEAPLHLPRTSVHQGPQSQGVQAAAGGITGTLRPRRQGSTADGGAQASGAAASSAAD